MKHTRTYEGTKAMLKGWKWCFFVNFGQNFLLLDPDPHSQYGFGSRRAKSLRIWFRIRITALNNDKGKPSLDAFAFW